MRERMPFRIQRCVFGKECIGPFGKLKSSLRLARHEKPERNRSSPIPLLLSPYFVVVARISCCEDGSGESDSVPPLVRLFAAVHPGKYVLPVMRRAPRS